MRILIVAARFPYPLYRADNLTVYRFIKYLAQRHEIDLAALDTTGDADRYTDELRPYCNEIRIARLTRVRSWWNSLRALASTQPLQLAYFYSPELDRTVRELVQATRYDLLYAHTIRAARYIDHFSDVPRVLAMQISMTLHYRRLRDHTTHWFWKHLYQLEHRRLRSYEPAVASRFSKVMLISGHDSTEIARTAPLGNVFYNPHGVDHETFSPDPAVEKEPYTMVFHGHMATMSNVDAVTNFCRSVFPAIRDAVPQAQLYVVGIKPPPSVVRLGNDPAITVTGFVDRPVDYIRKAWVSVDPLRVGAGQQNKVLEAMSAGLPVVATPVANEGIKAVDGENIVIAELGKDFADRVIELMNNEGQRVRLGNAARKFILDNWTWEKHLDELDQMFEELVGEHSEGNSLAG